MAKPNKENKTVNKYQKWDDEDDWPKHDIPRDPVAEKKSAKSAKRVLAVTAAFVGIVGAGIIAVGIMYSPIAFIGLAGIGGVLPSMLSAISDLRREAGEDVGDKPKKKPEAKKAKTASKLAKPGMFKSLFARLSGKKPAATQEVSKKAQPKPPQK